MNSDFRCHLGWISKSGRTAVLSCHWLHRN